MKQRTERIVAGVVAVLAIGGLVGGSFVATNAFHPKPQPTSTYRLTDPAPDKPVPSPEPTAEPTTEAEVVPVPVEPVVPAAPAPEAPVAPSAPETPVAPVVPPVVVEPPVVVTPPILCPSGSTSVDSDGYNDLACMPVICFSITLPDPTHPECDSPFRP